MGLEGNQLPQVPHEQWQATTTSGQSGGNLVEPETQDKEGGKGLVDWFRRFVPNFASIFDKTTKYVGRGLQNCI